MVATTAAACFAPAAHAQIVEQYFPTDLPGYRSDVTLPMAQSDPRVLQGQGLRVGGFILDASGSETAGYDSAPLGAFGGASPTLQTDADLKLNSDWSRDALGAQVGVDNHVFTSTSLANYTNWHAATGGALDIGEGRLSVGYDHVAQNLAPTELGVVGVTAPVPYADDDERVTLEMPFAQVAWRWGFEHQQFGFDNLGDPIPLDYAHNDHEIWTGSLTGLYQLSPGRSIVGLVRGSSAGYVPNGTPVRNDYDDVTGLVGVNFQATAVIELRALIGAEHRGFRFLPTQSGTIPTAELDLIWQPTRLTTLQLAFTREYEDPTFPFASSEVTTSGRVEVDHALRRDVELRAFAGVGSSNYGGGGNGLASLPDEQRANTTQMLTRLGAEAAWTINRHVALTLDYTHEINDFSGNVGAFVTPFNEFRSYNEDIATIGVTLTR